MDFPAFVKPIGRMAHFLIPVSTIDMQLENGESPRMLLKEYLTREFGGFTQDPLVWGTWGETAEAHVEYTVSFDGRERIPGFLEFLSTLCARMHEDCLYLEMGEKSYLIYPQL